MSSDLWRILIGAVIAAHGVGHVFFLVPTVGLAQWGGLTGRSWLLSGRIPEMAVKIAGAVLWLLAIVGFVAAGVGVWSQQEWWRDVAVASSAVSLLAVALFAQPGQQFLSAGVMDVIILVALLVFHWPAAALVGS
jgi:hypothetical protein